MRQLDINFQFFVGELMELDLMMSLVLVSLEAKGFWVIV